MKKILLSLMLITVCVFGKAQGVVFNEFYPNPSIENKNPPTKFNHEYFELYNVSSSPIVLDCYTVLAYDNIAHQGYVYQFQNGLEIPGNGFLVFTNSVTAPLTIRTDNLNSPVTYGPASNIVSWNQTNGTTGFLKLFTITGSTLTASGANLTDVDNFLLDPSSGEGISVFLFSGSELINGFIGSGSPALPSDFATITDFTIPATTGCPEVHIDLSAINVNDVELQSVTASTGNDNGYYRTTNGLCGTWKKSSTGDQTTPGVTNGGVEAGDFATVQASNLPCPQIGQPATWNGSIKINNSIYLPATYEIYEDKDNGLTITLADGAAIQAGSITDLNTLNFGPLVLTTGHALLVRVVANQNCVIYFRAFVNECALLPVNFKSFVANRSNSSSVAITWTTASEENSKGFNIQRNVGGVWTTIAYVPSQAVNGTSTSDLTYNYTDANSLKGITQYRIQQVDLDGKAKYSDIRAIRGDGTAAKIVVYPNPSADGKVNVVFEDNTAIRDVYVNDMQGRVVKSYKGITNNILVIERLTSGFYTIKITNRNTAASSVEKVVVK